MSDSRVVCTIDLTAKGKQFGTLGVPRSSNQWSDLTVPIVSIANGAGPTVVVIGGVHGDEPEGQVAALNLARTVQPEQVTGRVVVVPCASPEASKAYTRTWPSGINFNRSFPGDPWGTEDEQLADFMSTVLFPMSDVVVDIHSGGRGGAPPALVGDALGGRPGPAPRDGRRDDRLEHRLVLRLHGHRRHRPAGRRG